MVVKVKEFFENTRQVKNNDKYKKIILRGQRNTRYYERNLILSVLFLTQHNCTLSRPSSVQKSISHQSQRISSSSDTNHSTKSQKYKS